MPWQWEMATDYLLWRQKTGMEFLSEGKIRFYRLRWKGLWKNVPEEIASGVIPV